MPGGVAPKFASEKVSRYTGVSQLQLRVSRYTVQLRERTQKGDPHKLFREYLWGQKRGPKQAIFDHKKFSLLFCLALREGVPGPLGPGVKRESKITNFQVLLGFRLVFDSFSTFFELFCPRGRRGPGTPFRLFLGVFQGEAFLAPVDGQRYPNTFSL